MLEVIAAFLSKVASRLSGIARSTKSGLTAKDLHGDVWIAASDIGARRGSPIDLRDPADQELVLSRVYSQVRKQRDWRLHFAESLDVDVAEGVRLSERIGEKTSMDPVAVFDRQASMADHAHQLKRSHSQATAYVIALRNFDNDKPRLAMHLAISAGTLGARMDRAFEVVERQHSVLDGLDMIKDDFMPLECQVRTSCVPSHLAGRQAELNF